jgi:hypothetical protein
MRVIIRADGCKQVRRQDGPDGRDGLGGLGGRAGRAGRYFEQIDVRACLGRSGFRTMSCECCGSKVGLVCLMFVVLR